jgi:hypothetical protein
MPGGVTRAAQLFVAASPVAAGAMSKTALPNYIIQSVVHASELLRAFQSSREALRLCDIVERTGFNKGLCFRLLHTLRYCGLIEKVDETRYRLPSEMRHPSGTESGMPHVVLLRSPADQNDSELFSLRQRRRSATRPLCRHRN